MESPKLAAAPRLELDARFPPAAHTTSGHRDHQPFPQCRESGPSLTSPKTSREDGARCCPDSGCHAFPGLSTASSFLLPRLPPRAPFSDWLTEPGQFYPGQKVARQLVLFLAPPPKPADWTAESGVTLLCRSAGQPIRSSAYFTNWGSSWSRSRVREKAKQWERP